MPIEKERTESRTGRDLKPFSEKQMKRASKDELLSRFDSLSEDQKLRVLEFVKELTDTGSKGICGSEWLKVGGVIDLDSLQEMEAAIEEGCEKVDPSEW